MRENSKLLMTTIVLLIGAFSVLGHSPAYSLCLQGPADELAPETTVIVANQADARFGRDFSVLLKSLRLEWVIVDSPVVPDAVKDRNLILLGGLDAAYTGEIMRGLLTAGELEALRTPEEPHTVLVKASPWMEGRSVYICAGADLLRKRNAAEEAVRGIMASSPPASAWIRTRYNAPQDDNVRETLDRLRYAWDDSELPLADLSMDVGAEPRRRISALQAAEDVERLFYLFSHGYGGYAFFNQEGQFAQAEARILQEITTRRTWSAKDLSRLLYKWLGFITDCHLKIGDRQYAGHLDFWYDTHLELMPGTDGFRVDLEGEQYEVLSVNRQATERFAFPSLNGQGEPIYRLGMLSETEPAPLRLLAARHAEEREFEIVLQRSEFDYLSDDAFREDSLGGIPVLRVRGFGDVDRDELVRFVQTARAHRDEPMIVLDARGNGGGNETWPVQWIQALTDRRAGSVLVRSELNSKTTMAGRANLFASYQELYPGMDSFRLDAERFSRLAQAFEDGTSQPGWTAPSSPTVPLIPNDTTVVIVMNGLVASAGEGLLMRASQVENVVLVGENSRGALTFGNISYHQLPNSRLKVTLPINLNLFLDLESREGKGIAPDLWVPAADAVNYAIAAVRSGTITTRQPLSQSVMEQPFVPEKPWARVHREAIIRWLVVAVMTAVGALWSLLSHARPPVLAGVGAVWLLFGVVWILSRGPIGLGFLLAGAVCLVRGSILLWRRRTSPVEMPG